jgi:hypothetical protein
MLHEYHVIYSVQYYPMHFLAVTFVAHAQYPSYARMEHRPVENLWRFNLANVTKFCTNIFFNTPH